MIEQPLLPFPNIDLTLPLIPPRTRLYPLRPIGLGNPDVESLTSYLARLANAHCVPLATLAKLEFAPVINRDPRAARDKFNGSSSQTLNGGGDWTALTLVALEELTRVDTLHGLTLYPWRKVLSREKLLRPYLAWCPSCYTQWRQAGQTLYNPLLWHVRAVEICPHHRQALSQHCPFPDCRRRLPVVNNRGKLGYCPYCHRWLGVGEEEQRRYDLDWAWQLWLTGQLAEMFKAAPCLLADPQPETLARNLGASLERAAPNQTRGLAFQVGMSPSAIYRWINHAQPARLDLLARVCYHLDRPLLDMLTPNADEAVMPVRRTLPKLDVSALERRLEPFLNAMPPHPATQVARQLGLSLTALAHHFPGQYRQLVERYAQYRQRQQQCRNARLQRELQAFLQSQETPPPSLREVTRRLRMKPTTLADICPEQCRLIAQKYLAYHRARRTKAEAGLRQVLAATEAPPPSMAEVAARLGEDTRYLYKRFPELCRQVTRRHYNYRPPVKTGSQRLDHQHIHRQFTAIITAQEKPPPSIREVARRLKCGYTTLRVYHRDLCAQLLDQAQVYQADRISGLPARLNQILARNESPAPSLLEVARRLGVPAHLLQKVCPEVCAEILDRAEADRKAAKQQRKDFLDQVLAASDGPPPALTQVAKILNIPDADLPGQFPEESALITRRYQAYKAADKQAWQEALQAALASDQTPPPTVAQVAKQLGLPDDHKLRFHCPDLCQQIQHRRQAYRADRQHQLQLEFEAILAESQTGSPLTLMQVARRLGCTEAFLKRLFPAQAQMVIARRQRYYEARKQAAERTLQAVLEDEQREPPALNTLSKELGYACGTLQAYFPDLAAAVVAKRRAFIKARSRQRQHELLEEVKRITRELHEQGINPSRYQLTLRLSRSRMLADPAVLQAWQEARAELGLPT
jgi:AcrR family transcriptional regulator